ncbi:uncharacterized protein [Littorina saxatilis]|uniref:Uncharacterized protein n=1 Tax=Littorina saxatilis TaxID=31220 RepID=A0AAN9G2K5_9CAEN
MSLSQFFGILLCGATALAASTTSSPGAVDVKTAATNLVGEIRTLSQKAKNGMVLSTLLQASLGVQAEAANLIQQLPGDVSQCETSLVIKMAAAGTGSHEVLTLLLADDALSVLNGRLSLSLTFLEHVAQQLEDELSLSNDVGAQLSAVVFGTNATASIAKTADAVVTEVVSLVNSDTKEVRRQLGPWSLGNGWSVGTSGATWTSSSGRSSFNVKPTYSSGSGFGGSAGFTFKF